MSQAGAKEQQALGVEKQRLRLFIAKQHEIWLEANREFVVYKQKHADIGIDFGFLEDEADERAVVEASGKAPKVGGLASSAANVSQEHPQEREGSGGIVQPADEGVKKEHLDDEAEMGDKQLPGSFYVHRESLGDTMPTADGETGRGKTGAQSLLDFVSESRWARFGLFAS